MIEVNYSSSFNTFMHFGIYDCTEPVKVKVTWPNGETEEREIKSRNETVTIGEK